ncbi:MarR family transcriptional regulator [Kribbella sp. NPDC005582]|uniref:MarR family winged helix-turn-helix transcriptional regulator n=1 Tax=Kribbella sp. NPDC005582 TaxID=3156893 RepID=UPI0033A5DE15
MATHPEPDEPDLGVLSSLLLFAFQDELFTKLAERGFDDVRPRHGAVLAYLAPRGIRATHLALRSGQHKQIIGTLVDELETLGYLERRPDPTDRRAKLVCPTERGLAQMSAAREIITALESRHAERLGDTKYRQFKQLFTDVAIHQRQWATLD